MFDIKVVLSLGNGHLNGGHKDLILRSNKLGLSSFLDTYFFILDAGFRPNDESINKTLINIINFLGDWIWKICNCELNNTIYLPIDFSDQYIGCFRLTRMSDTTFSIDYGFTEEYDGVSLSPSKSYDFALNDSNYKVDTPTLSVNIHDVNEDIKRVIANLRTSLSQLN